MGAVHLHLHTRFSLLDGLGHEKAYAQKAAADGQPALAITDHGAMFGVIKFVKACVDAGIQPIIGAELYIVPGSGSRFDRSGASEREGADRGTATHLTVLARNAQGYQNLIKLCSAGWTEGFYYKPRIDKELFQQHADGLIATSGCPMSEVSRLLLAGKIDEAERLVCWYRDLLGEDNYFLEVQDHGLAMERQLHEGLWELHRRTGIPFVATNDAHYVDPSDADAHDVLLCIQTQSDYHDPNRMRMTDDQGRLLAAWHMLTTKEMEEKFRRWPGAVENTVRIAENIKFLPVVRGYHEDFRYLLPEYPVPEGHDAASWLRHLAFEGARRRYGGSVPQDRIEQIEKELKIIGELGLDNYFLLVQDFVTWARDRGIPVGHGRGSGVGSEVAYCLRITEIPPADYDLVFERFLHLYRVSMADFDIDFADDRRDEVVAYVKNKYGEDAVAQIATFGTMAARAAVRRVSKVIGVSLQKADMIAKAIPSLLEAKNELRRREDDLKAKGIDVPKKNMTIAAALEISPDLKRMYEEDPEARRVLDLAKTIEGVPANVSRHAGGFVIAPGKLTDFAPVAVSQGELIVQFDLEDVEDIGLVKMDFLGLRTLRVVNETIRLVRERLGEHIDLSKIPLDDAKTYELLRRGDCAGVFQFEGSGMRQLMRDMQPSNLEDLVAAVALFRPGPMEHIPTYIRRKHGLEPVEYPHPDLEPILKTTYGIIVYQEQVIQIAQRLAGFDLGKGDMLRRAIGKKKPDEMARIRQEFLDGVVANGYPASLGEQLWDDIVRFADYAFNKSHAVAYARLAYDTAYLKAHYLAEFYAALLTSEIGNHDKVAEYLLEAAREGITVLPPDINRSGESFTVLNDHTVVYGLAAVRDVGANAREIVIQRERSGPYRSLMDLCMRTSVNKRALQALIRAGACRELGDRDRLLAIFEDVAQQARQIRNRAGEGQLLLDDLAQDIPAILNLRRDPEPKPDAVKVVPPELALREEKEYLGTYVSGHPLDFYREYRNVVAPYDQLLSAEDGSRVAIGGIIASLRQHTTGDGRHMAFAILQIDEEHRVDLIVWPDLYEQVREQLEEGRFILAAGRLEKRELVRDEGDDEDAEDTVRQVHLKVLPERIRVVPFQHEQQGRVEILFAADQRIPLAAQRFLQGIIRNGHNGRTPVFIRHGGRIEKIAFVTPQEVDIIRERLSRCAKIEVH